jgi:hypothetical protein
MILVNSVSFFEHSKKAVEEFCNSEGIDQPDKIVEKLAGIAFRWPNKIVLMIGDDAEEQGASKNELFVRIMDNNMMGAIHFISKDYVRDELLDFLERWFPL